jgi:hypothetical protein
MAYGGKNPAINKKQTAGHNETTWELLIQPGFDLFIMTWYLLPAFQHL